MWPAAGSRRSVTAHTGPVAIRYPPLDLGVLRRVCEVLGDTDTGLIGREIGRLLRESNLPDPGETTKRERLFDALNRAQQRDQTANCVFHFLNTVMNPARFLSDSEKFEEWRAELSVALAFAGFEISEKGRVRKRPRRAETISEARARANRFRDKLRDRGVHPAVLQACEDEIRDQNYFHSVFEAAKSLAERVRQLSGLTGDGIPLITEAFGRKPGLPRIAFNRLKDRTDESEHDGNTNLLKGVFGAFRNTTGHRLKARWQIPEQDALDVMSTISLLHRRLDTANAVPAYVRERAA